MRTLFVLVAALIATAVIASPSRFEVFNRIQAPPGWVQGARAPHAAPMKLMIGVMQQNLDWLEKMFWMISDPQHPLYGHFLTPKEIMDKIAPRAEHAAAVLSWLGSLNSPTVKIDTSPQDAYIVECTVADVERLFSTAIHVYKHDVTGRLILRNAGAYSIPHELADIVTMVSGVADFPSSEGKQKPSRKLDLSKKTSADKHASGNSEVGSSGSTAVVVPWSVQTMYNIPYDLYTSNPSTSQCVVELGNTNGFLQGDYTDFCNQAASWQFCYPYSSISFVGQFTPSPPAGESTLDVDVMFSLSPTAISTYWTDKAWIYDLTVNLFNQAQYTTIPQVVSISYGWVEIDQCDASGMCSTYGFNNQQYVNATNVQFMKLGNLGVTILAGSGDTGAPGQANQQCGYQALFTIFPGASPYVTSVGATMLTSSSFNANDPAAGDAPDLCFDTSVSCANGTAEVACSYPTASITSGGGFSMYSPAPWYQTSVVNNYLSSGVTLPPSSMFNAAGRGFPDVSMIGHNYVIWINNTAVGMDGTSASTPAFATLVVKLNDWRLNNGLSQLGFINPLLYQMAAAGVGFRDITSGNNYCTEQACCPWGYNAAPGWDPVTGLGTPNFGQMLNYLQTQAAAPLRA